MLEYFEYLKISAKRIGKRQDWIMQEFEKECGPGSFQRMASLRQVI